EGEERRGKERAERLRQVRRLGLLHLQLQRVAQQLAQRLEIKDIERLGPRAPVLRRTRPGEHGTQVRRLTGQLARLARREHGPQLEQANVTDATREVVLEAVDQGVEQRATQPALVRGERQEQRDVTLLLPDEGHTAGLEEALRDEQRAQSVLEAADRMVLE